MTVPWEERIDEAHKASWGNNGPLSLRANRGDGKPENYLWRSDAGGSLESTGMLGVREATHKNMVNKVLKQAEIAARTSCG